MRQYRRALLPLGMVVGMMVCAYAAFFVGVKEDFPQPPGAQRYPLNIIKQTSVANEWSETSRLVSQDVSVYTLRENPQQGADYYREAFIKRRGWKEIPPLGQPRELGPGQEFSIVAFSRGKSRVVIAFTPAKTAFSSDTELNKILRVNGLKENDNLALVVAGEIP